MMTERRYYICDRRRRVRLRHTHRKLSAAVERCKQLNDTYDSIHGGNNAVFFCGDWCDVAIAAGYIDEAREWPWENGPRIDHETLKNIAAMCRLMTRELK